ncbi:hypothetical protein NEOLEDRAFT_1070129, partial [Neolentinus lepideus HHB14362 ss-1]
AKLQVLGKQKTAQYLHARNTTVKYQQQVANARKWLAKFFEQERQAEDGLKGPLQPGAGESTFAQESLPFEDPEFEKALDGPPVKCTPTVIAMYLVHKCFERDLKNATAVQIHAALIREYDQMDGDTYRGPWQYNEARKMWTGNPVRSAEVADVMASIKHKDGIDGGDRKHSLAMTKGCVEQLYAWSTAMSPPEKVARLPEDGTRVYSQAVHLRFRARASLGFVIWTRRALHTCIGTLQYKHLEFNDEHRKGGTPLDPPHFEVNLKNRKNWQRKQDKNQSVSSLGHNYKIYPMVDTPAIDLYTNMLNWLDFYELLLSRPLQPDDYIFPFIGPDCKVHPHRALSSDLVQKELNDFACLAKLRGAGSFTTHCYRRGGAQYRFMFAPIGERWTLARIRWWGGWAEKEHRDTLIRYLLDELYNYEEDHSDALCPIAREADKSLMGEAALKRPVSVADFHELAARLEERNPLVISQAIQQGVTTSLATILTPLIHALPATTPPFALFSQPLNFCFPTVSPMPQLAPYQPLPAASSPPRKNPAWIIPTVPTGSRGWEFVVRDWEHADQHRSLHVPLRDWTEEQIKQGGAAIYSYRKTIATEFIDVYHHDETKFKTDYPVHANGVTSLLNAIRTARSRRGETKLRRSKNGSLQERALRLGLNH